LSVFLGMARSELNLFCKETIKSATTYLRFRYVQLNGKAIAS
jgi:hypothetical protein